MSRTDIHCPSEIKPEDYYFVACAYIRIDGLGDCLALQHERKLFEIHKSNTGGDYSRHEHGGNCMVCGSVNAIYTMIFYHQKSNSYVRVGSDCAMKMEMGDSDRFRYFRTSIKDALERRAGQAKAKATLEQAGLGRVWEIWEASDDAEKRDWAENTLCDIVGKLIRYGSISEKQENFLKGLASKIDCRESLAVQEAEKKALMPDVPEGRVKVTGKVLTIKSQPGYAWGTYDLKMLVQSAEGWKVWSTCPVGEFEKGDTISYTVTITKSNTDSKFGFGKRPKFHELALTTAA